MKHLTRITIYTISVGQGFAGVNSKKNRNLKLRLFILLSIFFLHAHAQPRSGKESKATVENPRKTLPLLMPDNFDSLFLVYWRQEAGMPDAKNPLLEPAMPWDAGGVMAHGTVLHDPIDGLWKAWQVSTPAEPVLDGINGKHESLRRLTYLESKDGVTWHRPALEIVKWPGYPHTNILFDMNSGGIAQYASVLIDTANKEWPYEMFLIRNPFLGPDSTRVGHLPAPRGEKRGIYRYRSKDGKHWDLISGPLLHLGRGGDVAYFYRQQDGGYVGYFKQYSKEPGDRIIPYDNNAQQLVRKIGRSTSPDGNTWEPVKIVFERDWRDPGFAQYLELCPVQLNKGFIGMLTYYDASNKTMSLQMAASRDGINWWRPDRRPALPNPPLGDYGGGMMWQMHQPIVENGKMYVYYAGAQGLHGEILDSRMQPRLEVGNESVIGTRIGTLPFNSALCRATWDVDRLYALVPSAGGATVGSALTRPENSKKGKLTANVVVRKGGVFKAELLDENGKVIPGFSAADCVPVTGDHRRMTIQWKGGNKAPAERVRIKFILQQAFLYGYEWGG